MNKVYFTIDAITKAHTFKVMYEHYRGQVQGYTVFDEQNEIVYDNSICNDGYETACEHLAGEYNGEGETKETAIAITY